MRWTPRLVAFACLALVVAMPLTVAKNEPQTVEGRYVRATLLTPAVSGEPQKPMVADLRLENLAEEPVRAIVTLEGPGGKWIAQSAAPVTLRTRAEGQPAVTVPLTVTFHPGGGIGNYAEESTFTIQVEATPVDSEAAPDRLSLTLDARSGGLYVPGPGGLAVALVLAAVALSSSRVRPSSPR